MAPTPSTRVLALATRRLAPDQAGLAEAARLILDGRLVAFPTETVYGLGADGSDARAVASLYAAKGRPAFNPLIAHFGDIEAARREGRLDANAETLARAFWPGPLTLVVPRSSTGRVCDLARAGLDTVALRVPAHAIALDLLRRVGKPIVAPSANRSGHVSPTRPDHVLDDLDGRIDAVIEGGPTSLGIESTVVACLGGTPLLLRPGGLSQERLQSVLGQAIGRQDSAGAPIAPGALASHYAPQAAVRLEADTVATGEAALLFGDAAPRGLVGAVATLNLSTAGNVREAAANLFAYLRRLDGSGASTIAVTAIPEAGLGEAINDRLRRAAAGR